MLAIDLWKNSSVMLYCSFMTSVSVSYRDKNFVLCMKNLSMMKYVSQSYQVVSDGSKGVYHCIIFSSAISMCNRNASLWMYKKYLGILDKLQSSTTLTQIHIIIKAHWYLGLGACLGVHPCSFHGMNKKYYFYHTIKGFTVQCS